MAKKNSEGDKIKVKVAGPPKVPAKLLKNIDLRTAVDERSTHINVSVKKPDSDKKPSPKLAAPNAGVAIPVRTSVSTPKTVPKLKIEKPKPETTEAEIAPEPVYFSKLPSNPLPKSIVENSDTDKAVDQIMSEESDKLLDLEDRKIRALQVYPAAGGFIDILKLIFWSRWAGLWIIVIVAVIGAIPFTRYGVLGLFIDRDVSVYVVNSVDKSPIYGASVSYGSSSEKTNYAGKAIISVPLGKHTLKVTKKYYITKSDSTLVKFSGAKDNIGLVARGGTISFSVVDKISGLPLKNARISIDGTSASTNSDGKAEIVLPDGASNDQATISLSGYNSLKTNFSMPGSASGTVFSLTPNGKVYYLSDTDGSINVDSINYDGSSQTVVLAGSPSQTRTTTQIFPSSDSRYVVLLANRNSSGPGLYLINTTSGNGLSEFDSSSATFDPIGWIGDYFIYALTYSKENSYTAGSIVIKSFDAKTNQTNQIDANDASGTSDSYAYQQFSGISLVGNYLVYNAVWQESGGYSLRSSNDYIRSVDIGSGSTAVNNLQTINAAGINSITSYQASPSTLDIAVNNGFATYYQYQNNQLSANGSINPSLFGSTSPSYALSPNGKYALELNSSSVNIWNVASNSSTLVPDTTGYKPYAISGNDYVVVSRLGYLYIVPDSNTEDTQPVKLTEYLIP